MKTHDVQRLHDSVKALGDAALDIATALSAFLSDTVDAGVLPVEPERKPFFGREEDDPESMRPLTA